MSMEERFSNYRKYISQSFSNCLQFASLSCQSSCDDCRKEFGQFVER